MMSLRCNAAAGIYKEYWTRALKQMLVAMMMMMMMMMILMMMMMMMMILMMMIMVKPRLFRPHFLLNHP